MLRGWDSNPRPSGYEPDELPLLYPAVRCKGTTFSIMSRGATLEGIQAGLAASCSTPYLQVYKEAIPSLGCPAFHRQGGIPQKLEGNTQADRVGQLRRKGIYRATPKGSRQPNLKVKGVLPGLVAEPALGGEARPSPFPHPFKLVPAVQVASCALVGEGALARPRHTGRPMPTGWIALTLRLLTCTNHPYYQRYRPPHSSKNKPIPASLTF